MWHHVGNCAYVRDHTILIVQLYHMVSEKYWLKVAVVPQQYYSYLYWQFCNVFIPLTWNFTAVQYLSIIAPVMCRLVPYQRCKIINVTDSLSRTNIVHHNRGSITTRSHQHNVLIAYLSILIMRCLCHIRVCHTWQSVLWIHNTHRITFGCLICATTPRRTQTTFHVTFAIP